MWGSYYRSQVSGKYVSRRVMGDTVVQGGSTIDRYAVRGYVHRLTVGDGSMVGRPMAALGGLHELNWI